MADSGFAEAKQEENGLDQNSLSAFFKGKNKPVTGVLHYFLKPTIVRVKFPATWKIGRAVMQHIANV